MNRPIVTLIEVVVLAAVALGLALAGNGLRRQRLELGKNYFEKPPLARAAPARRPPETRPAAGRRGAAAPPPAAAADAHGLRVITFEQAREVLDDPLYETGVAIFIDARDQKQFAAGHIPGALRLDPYDSSRYIDRLLAATADAERIIVYCQGGDCQDSLYAARELHEALGVPLEKIWLYAGGMSEWRDRGGRLESGPEP